MSDQLDNETYGFLLMCQIHYPNAYKALMRSMQNAPRLGYIQLRTLNTRCPELKEFKPNAFAIKNYARKQVVGL